MALQDAGKTARFWVQYEDTADPPSHQLANAVLATCEKDLLLLNSYLPTDRGAHDLFKTHPVVIQITPTAPQPGGASNTGFKVGIQSYIKIHPFSPSGPAITEQFARFLFVAEMSEILMSAYGWTPNGSQGEALSRVLAELLYPDQAYDTASSVSPGPWINNWLNASPRPDWVKSEEATDLDQISYGCGILFINYLRSQLNFSLRDICGAGGANLKDRYKNLTGQTDEPKDRMESLLNKHFLAAGVIAYPSNNPFPLYEGADRIVTFGFEETKGVLHPSLGGGKAHLAPFFTCPAKDYRYWEFTRSDAWKIIASATGFGQPKFQWKVNGVPLLSTSGDLQLNTAYAVPDPNHPSQPQPAAGLFHFAFASADSLTRDALSSALTLTSLSVGGSYDLQVTAEVSETVAGEGPASATQSVGFETRVVIYEPQYYADQENCEKEFVSKLNHLPRLQQHIEILKTLPDPPPPGVMRSILEQVAAVREEVNRLADTDPRLAHAAARYVALVLNVPPLTIFGNQLPRAEG